MAAAGRSARMAGVQVGFVIDHTRQRRELRAQQRVDAFGTVHSGSFR